MMNAYCDGGNCTDPNAETRKLPCGQMNLIVCIDCYNKEIAFRKDRNIQLAKNGKGFGERWDIPEWDSLAIYEPARG